MHKLTFLEYDQIWKKNRLEIFKKIDAKAVITDFAIVLGGTFFESYKDEIPFSNEKKGYYWTKTGYRESSVWIISNVGLRKYLPTDWRSVGCRLVLKFSNIDSMISNKVNNRLDDGILEVEYGYYPRSAASKEIQNNLEDLFNRNLLHKTNFTFTVNRRTNDNPINPEECKVYEYNKKMYIRVQPDFYGSSIQTLSNGETYNDKDFVWVEVEPVKWLVDEKEKMMITKEIIFSGIPFNRKTNFKTRNFYFTDIKKFMDKYISKEIFEIDINKLKQKQFSNGDKDYTEEQKLINKILVSINELSFNEQAIYKQELDKILKEYETVEEQLSPVFEENLSFYFKDASIVSAKVKLLSGLDLLLFELTSKTGKLIKKINSSIKYINDLDYKEEVFTSVISFLKVLDKLDDKTKNIFKTRLLDILTSYLGKSKKMLDRKIELTTDNEINLELDLELEISKLYDELLVYVKKNLTVISELLNIKNIENEECDSLLRQKYLCIKEINVEGFLDKFNEMLDEYKQKLSKEENIKEVIESFYNKVDAIISIMKIILIKKNIKNIENYEEVVEVENNFHSFDISYYLGIQSFIEDMMNYIYKEQLDSLIDKDKHKILNALDKTILECNEIIESNRDAKEKFELIGMKVFNYQRFVNEVIDYSKSKAKYVVRT